MAPSSPIDADDPYPPRRRWVKRLAWVAGIFAVLTVCALASVPWYLGSEAARQWMLSRANATLAPAKLHVSSFRFSWFGRTEMTDFTIIDAQGEPVVRSKQALWDRNLVQILFDRPRYGTLTLDGTTLDVEREKDGRVDLYEALRPILSGPPNTSLTILAHGSLRLSSPGLERPIEGRRLSLRIQRPPAPEPMTWSVDLAEPSTTLVKNTRPTLHCQGKYDRWKPGPQGLHDLEISVEGRDWPLWIEAEGLQAQGSWTGRIDPSMHSGRWRFQGQSDLNALALQGPLLRGEHLKLDRFAASWSVSQTPDGWRLDSLDASSDLGEVRTIASPSGRSWTALEGRVDLAQAIRRLPDFVPVDSSMNLNQGQVQFRVDRPESSPDQAWAFTASIIDLSIRQEERALTLSQPARISVTFAEPVPSRDESHVSARVEIPELVWTGEDSSRIGPLSFEAEAAYLEEKDVLELSRLAAGSLWGQVSASGRLTDLRGACVADLSGSIEPDWDGLNELLSREIEPGARIEGQPARFSVRTALRGAEALDDLDGTLALGFDQIDIYGMKLRDLSLSAHSESGTVAIEPIVASLNGGRVHLEPLLDRGDDGLWTLRMDSSSRIEKAEVNDEVSRRVLSYVAPVLDRATRVNGRISATFDRAEFPLGPDLARSARVEGKVVFDDVAFEPGPLANNIMALAGRPAKTITLDDPVLLMIADGKVHQTGLKVPIGDLTDFSLAGDVGFDRSLDLIASIPMTSKMVGNLPVVSGIVEGARINVPIGGTLAKPKIDRDQFRAEMKTLERSLLERTATRGAAELLFRLTQPRPQGEDGLTPRERRQQRRMERQKKTPRP